MPPSTVAGIITAIGVCITAVGGLIAALTLFIPILRQVKQVHTLVNQKASDDAIYQRDLIEALRNAGIDVPRDKSLKEGEDVAIRSEKG